LTFENENMSNMSLQIEEDL